MQAHTVCIVCIGSTKRPLAPVLPVIVSEKLNNVPRLLRMDICINSYQQLTPQTSLLPTGPNAHSICRPILYVLYVQVASARFARFSYCGRGFTRSARFTSYGNPVCTNEAVKLNTSVHSVEAVVMGVQLLWEWLCSLHIAYQLSVCPSLK